jgi:zinc/manganese transport system permease protein
LGVGVALAILLAIVETWAGIALAYVSDWPPTFWISTLSAAVYLVTIAASHARRDAR